MNDYAQMLALIDAIPDQATVTLQKHARDLAGITSARSRQALEGLLLAGHAQQRNRCWRVRLSQIMGPDALGEYRIMGGLAADRLIEENKCARVDWRGPVRSVRQVARHRLLRSMRNKVAIIPIADVLAHNAESCRPPGADDLVEYVGPDVEGYFRFDHKGQGAYSDRWVEPDGMDGVYRLQGRRQSTDERPRWLWRIEGRRRIAESDQGHLLCYHLAGRAGSPVSNPFYRERAILLVGWLPRAVYQSLIALGTERIASEPTAEKPWTGFKIPPGQTIVCLDLVRTMLTANIQEL